MEKPVVIVTGSASGIGAGIAKILSCRSWAVVVNDIDANKTEAMAEKISGLPVIGDVQSEYKNIVDTVIDRYGRLDGLVNNAGILRKEKLADITEVNLKDVMSVNFEAAVSLSTYSLEFLRQHNGSIVNIVSFTVNHPLPEAAIYSSSKSALLTFTRQAAVEWGQFGVRVNAIGPGMVLTEMAEKAYKNQKTLNRRKNLVPLKRIGLPEEVGTVAAFLLSEDASYVSGQCIMVDGGQSWTLSTHIPS